AAIGDEQLTERRARHRDFGLRFSSETSAPGSRAPSNRPGAAFALGAVGDSFSAKRGRWPGGPDGVWQAGLGRWKVRDGARAIRLGWRQRAIPHPALCAAFPSRA